MNAKNILITLQLITFAVVIVQSATPFKDCGKCEETYQKICF